jgi:hypothetical protein
MCIILEGDFWRLALQVLVCRFGLFDWPWMLVYLAQFQWTMQVCAIRVGKWNIFIEARKTEGLGVF